MRLTRFIAIPVISGLIILGACSSPATTTPPVTTPPVTTPPVTTPPVTTPPVTTPPVTTPPVTTPPVTTPPVTTPPVIVPTGPAKFVLSNLTSVPQDGIQNPKQMTALFFTVTNTGAEAGTYNVAVTLNGVPYDLTDSALGNKNLSIKLGSLESANIVVNVTEEVGTYEVTVKSAAGDLTLPIKIQFIER